LDLADEMELGGAVGVLRRIAQQVKNYVLASYTGRRHVTVQSGSI